LRAGTDSLWSAAAEFGDGDGVLASAHAIGILSII